jgi:hydrogenase expression/formation protein HypD
MKYLSEYRNPELVKHYINEIHRITTKPWNIMEICGGQTHALVKNGLLDLLPKKHQNDSWSWLSGLCYSYFINQ